MVENSQSNIDKSFFDDKSYFNIFFYKKILKKNF